MLSEVNVDHNNKIYIGPESSMQWTYVCFSPVSQQVQHSVIKEDRLVVIYFSLIWSPQKESILIYNRLRKLGRKGGTLLYRCWFCLKVRYCFSGGLVDSMFYFIKMQQSKTCSALREHKQKTFPSKHFCIPLHMFSLSNGEDQPWRQCDKILQLDFLLATKLTTICSSLV